MKEKSHNNISKVILIFLFLMPLLDVFTSFMIHFQERSSYLVLGIKFSFLLFLIVLNLKYQNKKVWWYGSAFFLYLIIFFFFVTKDSFFFLEAQGLFRTFYFPFLFLSLTFLQKQGMFSITRSQLCLLLFSYLFFLVVPQVFHIGFQSYAHSKMGGVGWFYSTNEIGGILAILGSFLIQEFFSSKRFILFFLFFFYVFGIFVLGSKAPVLALFIIVGSFFIKFLVTLFQKRDWKKFFVSSILSCFVVILLGFVLYSSSFYKNIKIHLDFLGIREVKELFTFHHIDHFIFSERLSFLLQTHEVYQNQSRSRQVFGMGILESPESGTSMKMIEMDIFDIFYHYGICGLLLFLYPFVSVFQKRKYFFDEIISISLIVLLSFFTGHILVAPSVSLIVTLVLLPKREEVK